jgi:hypothetical protein
MSFRLTNALATFQKLVNNIVREYLDTFYIIYLDNILIYSKELSIYIKQVKKVL